MISFSKHIRSSQTEIMDTFSLQGEEMESLLTDLKRVNTLLGGVGVTTNGIKELLKHHPKDKKVRIVDLGCGDGELLRQCALWSRKNKFKVELIGIDANPHILKEAKTRSKMYPEIKYRVLNIFSEEIKTLDVDICLCTLFLHHFKEDPLVSFLENTLKQTKIAIVVNDLHRHTLAYYLFMLLSIFIKNKMIIEDGLTSVLRGFKREDLVKISQRIQVKSQISWKWAFRFQWIIQK